MNEQELVNLLAEMIRTFAASHENQRPTFEELKTRCQQENLHLTDSQIKKYGSLALRSMIK